MYSTIKKKKCKCNNCNKMPSIGYDGWYYLHAPEKIKEKQDAKTKKQRSDANEKKLSKVRSLINTEANIEGIVSYLNKGELQEWFEYHLANSNKRCENCGVSLAHYNRLDLRASQHHIIEKSPTNGCPSVATELLNHAEIGKWCCHSQLHTSNANMVKMPVFPLLKERFLLFKDKIALHEIKKIPDCFLLT